MAKTDNHIEIPPGLSALYLPDLTRRNPNRIGTSEPMSPEEVLAQTNKFLAELTRQGVEVKAAIPVQVRGQPIPGAANQTVETRQIIIVKR
jgi:hypothetical protein